MSEIKADFLTRSEQLFGDKGIRSLEEADVVICGLGGVGSYAAEAIARSGVGQITLIDFDTVNITNINRQLIALHSNIGESKCEIMSRRIADINPSATIIAIEERITPENVAALIDKADFCIDAIDDVPAKISVIRHCIEQGIGIVSSMGTGNKLQPELLRIADIADTQTCPLAKAVRLQLRKIGIESGVQVIFSTEKPISSGKEIGSCAFVPSVAGLMAASVAIRHLTGIK